MSVEGVDALTAVIRECDPNSTLDARRLAVRLYDRGVRAATPLDELDVPDFMREPAPPRRPLEQQERFSVTLPDGTLVEGPGVYGGGA